VKYSLYCFHEVCPLYAFVGWGCYIATIGALTTGALSGQDAATGVVEEPLEGVGSLGDLACVTGLLVSCSGEVSALVPVFSCGCFVAAET